MRTTSFYTAMITFSCLLVLSPAVIRPAYAVNMNIAQDLGVTFGPDRIENTGNILLVALPAAAVGLSLYHEDLTGLFQYGVAALLTEGTTLALKNNVHELRPNGSNYLSFPSGHASTTFTAAEFIRKRYGWGLGIAAYALAAFTGYSRVESREHYFHDVAAGAAIGITSSYVFTKPFHNFQIQPTTDRETIRPFREYRILDRRRLPK